MIPKTIHYCWFGGKEKPEQALRCIDSWKKHLSDYEFKEWNEKIFDINQNQYVKEAYFSRKFAFVTDYVRLYALYTEGGVYMDTDVEVIGSYNSFLHHKAFSGFETDVNVLTGMMAAEKGSVWAKELLDQYNNRKFILPDGSFDMRTNTEVITRYMVDKGLILNNTLQDIPDLCTMYPADYFCPKDHRTGKIKLTKNSVCIHHFAGSWLKPTLRHQTKLFLVKIFGEKIISKISDIITLRAFKHKKRYE